jgi:hypothetical protein
MPPPEIFQPHSVSMFPLRIGAIVGAVLRSAKNMTEKIDLSKSFPYNACLDDMDFRCSNSVAALAVFVSSVASAFFAPSAGAGDRIEFSAPAIPLGVPQPEVEVKEPAKMIGSGSFSEGTVGGVEMAMPSQYFIFKPKTRDKNDWGLDPRLDQDPDQRKADDWFITESDSTRGTNNNNLNKAGLNLNPSGGVLQPRNDVGQEGGQNAFRSGGQSGFDGDNSRFGSPNGIDKRNTRFGAMNGLDRETSRFDSKNGSDREDSRFGAKNGLDRENSRFGAPSGSEKEYARSGDRLGQGLSSARDESIWTKVFRHDGSVTDRLNPMQFVPAGSDTKEANGSSYEERMNNSWPGQDSGHPAPFSPGYTGFTPLDIGQSRQFGEQAEEGQGGSLRAWEPPASPEAASRSFSTAEQFNASRVVAPNRPAILTMPQRPGDPH